VILEAAERVFAREGYETAKVQQVAKEAGISLGTLYEVFPGKVDLWRAIHERRLAELFEATLEEMADLTGKSALDRLVLGVGAYTRYLVAHPNYLRLQIMDGSAWALGIGLRSDVQIEAWERGKTLMKDMIASGIAEGSLVEDDPDLLGQIMVAMHQARLAHWIISDMAAAPTDIVGQIQEHTIRAFCPTSVVEKALRRFRSASPTKESSRK
jgi:AcrR family transcriptional regulator